MSTTSPATITPTTPPTPKRSPAVLEDLPPPPLTATTPNHILSTPVASALASVRNTPGKTRPKVRRPPAEIERILAEYQASGLTLTQFARQTAIPIATLHSWVTKRADGAHVQDWPKCASLVSAVPSNENRPTSSRFAPVQLYPKASARSAPHPSVRTNTPPPSPLLLSLKSPAGFILELYSTPIPLNVTTATQLLNTLIPCLR
jgi:hypothetical protein